MKFSIITPTYKRPEELERAIRSVIDQATTDWEMIVINDDPGNGTRGIVTSFNDERIIFLENEQNLGVNASRNKGLDNISPDSDWVIFLDDDDQLHKDALSMISAIVKRAGNDWIVSARGTSESMPTTSAPGSGRYYSYLWDYLIKRRFKGDATHCIKSDLIRGPKARVRFPTLIKQAEEWLFYCELGTYSPLYYEQAVTTLTDGYTTQGLNLRRRTFSEQIKLIPTLIREARGRRLYYSPGFWLYIKMRIIRAIIK